ncbi:adipocyte plasma membrane-associated protein-like [Dorcoceras hygrometricum]|uniref:Adipocyte plasma membrane-associated protein-like n=1 Tax=Dorcoceras hygrometricum TaxID=472368 RepID=A0A2Z7BJI2_9LAMI|nr:adipocyte plasma membrane-associated protein-like [Dorcoceras hygrometricum]
MTPKLHSIATTAIVFVATLLVSLDNVKIWSKSYLKNETSMVGDVEDYELIGLPGGAVGPESFAFDAAGGGPYTGVSDGRVILWRANESRWVDFAVTSPDRLGCEGPKDHSVMEHLCGRPLGLRFNQKTGHLYIADAYMGLIEVGPNGGLGIPLAKQVDRVNYGFTNSLDIDQSNGLVYFTDSSTRFPRSNHIPMILCGDNTGRLMKFDPKTKETAVLLSNLMFPNGVALSKNGDFLLFVETTTCKLFKFWLKTSKAGILEVLTQFPGFPDNIKRNKKGEFWVGITSQRTKFLDLIISNPWIGKLLLKMSIDVTKFTCTWRRFVGGQGAMGIRLDEDGNVMEILDGTMRRKWKFVSEVEEEDGHLWVGSVTRSFVVKQKILRTSSNLL